MKIRDKRRNLLLSSLPGLGSRWQVNIRYTGWMSISKPRTPYSSSRQVKSHGSADRQDECTDSANRWYYDPNDNDCYRAFERDGHFENLLIADKSTGNGGKEWKYGPFLTTRLSPTLPDDFLELPSEAEMRDVQPSDVKGPYEYELNWLWLNIRVLVRLEDHVFRHVSCQASFGAIDV